MSGQGIQGIAYTQSGHTVGSRPIGGKLVFANQPTQFIMDDSIGGQNAF